MIQTHTTSHEVVKVRNGGSAVVANLDKPIGCINMLDSDGVVIDSGAISY